MAEGLPKSLLGDADRSDEAKPALEPARSPHSRLATPASSIAPTPDPAAKVVSLFAEQRPFEADLDELDDVPADWPSALQLIRDVGAQVRRERDLAQDLVKQSRTLIQRSLVQAEDAEKRADASDAQASEASLRADRADERARLAEERALDAEARARIARAGEEEANLWLRRLYASLRREFDGLGGGQA